MHRWAFWTNSQCPGCHQDNEDEEHLFQCTHQRCRDTRLEATQVLRQCLQMCKTEPLLRDTIIQKAKHHVGLSSLSGMEIDDNCLRIAVHLSHSLIFSHFVKLKIKKGIIPCLQC
jgi:hypothetical protein